MGDDGDVKKGGGNAAEDGTKGCLCDCVESTSTLLAVVIRTPKKALKTHLTSSSCL